MRHAVIYGFLLIAALAAADGISAQKYPERRIAREGNKAYGRGDYQAAEEAYRRAAAADPQLKEARFNLGSAAFRQEDGEEAAKAWLGIATDSTAHPSMVSAANFNLGNTMLAGQQIEDAIEFYKQALRIDPNDIQAKYNLAYAKKLLQNPPPEDDEQDDDQQGEGGNDQDEDGDGNSDGGDDKEDGEDDDQGGDGENDPGEDNADGDGDDTEDEGDPPPPDPSGSSESTIDPLDAEQMLDAIQDEEDKTREKMNTQEVQAVGRTGRNW